MPKPKQRACGKCPYRPLTQDDELEEHCFDCAYIGYLYVRGCRCQACLYGNKERHYRQRDARRKKLDRDMSLASHGQASTYINWGCRCDPCKAAHSARCAIYQKRRKQNGGERLFPEGWHVQEEGFRRVVISG